MAGELDLIEVSLLSGESDKQTLTFTPGTPANHVGVGTGGQWIVLAEGVQPVHLYLVYDGRSVYVASGAPNARTLLAGADVGTDWVKATIPCELRFGGACLILRHVPRTKAPADEDATMHDGGALWQAAQRVASTPALGPQYPSARPAAGAPAPRPTNPDDDAPTPMLVAGQDPHSPRVRTLPPTFLPSPPSPSRNEITAPPATKPAAANELRRFWQEASLAKKATLALMPFALGASYQLLLADAPEPAPTRTPAGTPTDRLATGARDAAAAPVAAQVAPAADAAVTEGAEIDSDQPAAASAQARATPLPRGSAPPSARPSTPSPPAPSTTRRSSTRRSPPATPTTPVTRKRRASSARRPGTPIAQAEAAHEIEALPRMALLLLLGGGLLATVPLASTSLEACGESGACTQLRQTNYGALLGWQACDPAGPPLSQCIQIGGNPKDCTGVLSCNFAVNAHFRSEAELVTYTVGEQSQGCYLCATPTCIGGDLAWCEPISHRCMLIQGLIDGGAVYGGSTSPSEDAGTTVTIPPIVDAGAGDG